MPAQTPAQRHGEYSSARHVVVPPVLTVLVAGGAGGWVTSRVPAADHRTYVAAFCAAATLALCLAVVVSGRRARAVRRLTARWEAREADAARLVDVTVPAVVKRLRDGTSVDAVLAEERPDEQDPQGRMLHALVTEVGNGERRRASAMAACANAAGRVQALTTSMLADLREMEERHDERVLGDLLRVDHSTAQAGRIADSIAVLTGARSGRRWTKPIVMESVLRGALGRISAYQRVRIHSTCTAAVAGYAAEGVMHALAELMDNAASFSPPTQEVHVYAEETYRGVVVAIEDGGLVMGPAALARAELAVSAEELDLTTLSGTRLGLAVVGCLARKYGLKVSFRPSSRGGTGVVVIIPQRLVMHLSHDALLDSLASSRTAAPRRISSPPTREIRRATGDRATAGDRAEHRSPAAQHAAGPASAGEQASADEHAGPGTFGPPLAGATDTAGTAGTARAGTAGVRAAARGTAAAGVGAGGGIGGDAAVPGTFGPPPADAVPVAARPADGPSPTGAFGPPTGAFGPPAGADGAAGTGGGGAAGTGSGDSAGRASGPPADAAPPGDPAPSADAGPSPDAGPPAKPAPSAGDASDAVPPQDAAPAEAAPADAAPAEAAPAAATPSGLPKRRRGQTLAAAQRAYPARSAGSHPADGERSAARGERPAQPRPDATRFSAFRRAFDDQPAAGGDDAAATSEAGPDDRPDAAPGAGPAAGPEVRPEEARSEAGPDAERSAADAPRAAGTATPETAAPDAEDQEAASADANPEPASADTGTDPADEDREAEGTAGPAGPAGPAGSNEPAGSAGSAEPAGSDATARPREPVADTKPTGTAAGPDPTAATSDPGPATEPTDAVPATDRAEPSGSSPAGKSRTRKSRTSTTRSTDPADPEDSKDPEDSTDSTDSTDYTESTEAGTP